MGTTVPKKADTARERAALIRDQVAASEAKYVGDWVDALVRSIEALRAPVRDDPALHKARADLDAITQSCLNHVGDIRIVVEESSLSFEGQCVYHSSAREGSLSLALFRDGVREIALHRGLEREELWDFVNVMKWATDRREKGPDDVVTLLWERSLRHIEVVCVPLEEPEDHEGAGAAAGEIPWPSGHETNSDAEGEGEVRSDDWSLPIGTESAWNESLLPQLEFGEIEAANIRMLAIIEQAVSPRDEVLEILSAILGAEEEPAQYLEIASTMGSIVEQAALEGDLLLANQLMDRLRQISGAKPVASGAFLAAADQIVRDIGRHDFVSRLGPVLTAHPGIDLAALTSFLARLGPSSAPGICDLLSEISEMKVRRALCEALAISCKNDVDILIERLSDSRWFVVRNILYILGRIAHQGVERALGGALCHNDVRVRSEAVRALRGIDTATSRAYLNSALRDPDKSVRILVAHLITRRGDERAARIIWTVIESPEFATREADERTAFFEALGLTGSDTLVPRLEQMLISGAKPRSGAQEGGKDAALALAWLGTPAALAVLARELESKRPTVRDAVARALEAVRKGSHKNQ
jgi:hypothetical protein